MKKNICYILIIVFIFFLGGCSIIGNIYLSQAAIHNFRGTEGLQLAKAVMTQNVSKIKKVCAKNPSAMYVEDTKYHYTVLHWAVGLKKYHSLKALLEAEMDPNVQSSVGGETPLYLTASEGNVGIEYMQLLLDYGADPDIGNTAVILPDLIQSDGRAIPFRSRFTAGKTPLMELPTMYIPHQKTNLEKAKLLIEGGHADINKKDENDSTASVMALHARDVDMAYYLIVELKANVKDHYYYEEAIRGRGNEKEPKYPVDLLRGWIYPLDSEKYKKKMEIVEEFARQGIDYWSTPIHPLDLEKIKIIYPDDWEEYIKVY